MRVSEKMIQKHVALALAHLCTPGNLKTIFIDKNGKIFGTVNICWYS